MLPGTVYCIKNTLAAFLYECIEVGSARNYILVDNSKVGVTKGKTNLQLLQKKDADCAASYTYSLYYSCPFMGLNVPVLTGILVTKLATKIYVDVRAIHAYYNKKRQ